nr:resuscitation-promoting factor [Streptomyces ruber]
MTTEPHTHDALAYGPYGSYGSYGSNSPFARDARPGDRPRMDEPRDELRDEPRGEPREEPQEDAPEAVLPRQADGGRAGARRAARRRRTVERPAPLRRLVPQALVVAFLAGGTTAFVAKDKAIELNVDGEPRTLHTFADDVTELLARQGVAVGAHDVVAPDPGAPLATGDEVAVHYGRPVRLTLDGRRRELWTTARTVEEALREFGVRSEGAYVSTDRSRPIGRAGLALDVRTERTVTVMADGRARRVRTNAATVREVVDQAGITLAGQDTTSVPQESFPRDGQTITVLRIKGRKEIREEPIPFDVERQDDPELFRGTEVVEYAGEAGVRRVTYSLRTVNGVKQKPRRLSAEMIRPPRTQVVKVGTKPLPTSVAGTDHLDWNGLAVCESGGRPDAVDSSGTYGGLYQFDRRTWQSLGGQGRPQDAPAAEQTYRAKKLYLERGASPWPHCGSTLR